MRYNDHIIKELKNWSWEIRRSEYENRYIQRQRQVYARLQNVIIRERKKRKSLWGQIWQ